MKHCGIYIHIPFCLRKCQYCDFVSFPDFSKEETYFAALQQEMSLYERILSRIKVDSIFFGGGTPSAVSADYLISVLEYLQRFSIAEDAEITLEANPATLTEENLLRYRAAGFNRLSIGLQSANDMELAKLGRLHNADDFLENYCMARDAGFSNINVDIMFGIPEQTPESFEKTLQFVCNLQPEHISAYSLILEEGTPFYRKQGELQLPTEEEERQMYQNLKSLLAQKGYQQYEISNFAREGFACRHNLKYWKMKPFLGFGLAAHSFFDGNRYANTDDMQAYINMLKQGCKPVAKTARETAEELFADAVITGFRLREGIDVCHLMQQFGISFEQRYAKEIARYLQSGHMVRTEKGYTLTEKGVEISNYILSDLI